MRNVKYLLLDFVLSEVGWVLVTDLLDVEKTAAYTYVGFTDVFNTVYDSCADSSGDTVVVCFADAAYCCDICLDKVMLGKVYD